MTQGHCLFPEAPVVVVTGGSGGLGLEIGKELAREGATVVLGARRLSPPAEELIDALVEDGARVSFLGFDVRDEDAVRAALRCVVDEHGSLFGLVNNAGVAADGFLLAMSRRKWDDVVDTNLTGTFNCTKQALKLMARQRRGSIINVVSVAGLRGVPGQANYSASKAGVISLTRTAAVEGASRGVRVNAVAPGPIDVGMGRRISRETLDAYLAHVPLGRAGCAVEVARVVAFMLSDRASYVTGAVVPVDGGLTA